MIRPGGDGADGVYWTRLATTSNQRAAEIEAEQVTEDITARIVFRIRQVTTSFPSREA